MSYRGGALIAVGIAAVAVVQWIVSPLFFGVEANSDSWFRLFGAPSAWHGLPKMAVAMFSHTSFSHVAYNLVLLTLSTKLLHERITARRYVILFVLGSLFAFIGQTAANQYVYGSTVLLLGASGGTWFLLAYASLTVRRDTVRWLAPILAAVPIAMLGWALLTAVILERSVANAGHASALVTGVAAALVVATRNRFRASS